MTYAIHPATAERWPDLEALFLAKGCSMARGCWCMYYRESGKTAVPDGQTPAQARKQRMQALVETDTVPGLLAYAGTTPVGWVSLAPRAEFIRLRRSPILKAVDAAEVWAIVCFVVPPAHRHQGVARALLQGAIAHARGAGAALLEAYPIDKPERGRDDWLWNGALSMYLKAGFTEVARRKPERPIVRMRLRPEPAAADA